MKTLEWMAQQRLAFARRAPFGAGTRALLPTRLRRSRAQAGIVSFVSLVLLLAVSPRVWSQGAADPGFDPKPSALAGGLAVQPDGKILFTATSSIGGVACHGLARLNADGTLDAAFAPDFGTDAVWAAAVQADGKIVVGGRFATVNGVTRHNLARLNPNGTLDPNFDPQFDDQIFSVVLQSDGKILVCGEFTTANAVTRPAFARLNPDGSLDSAFDPGVTGIVHAIAVQPDGKILIGGNSISVGTSVVRQSHARLNANGTLDAGFEIHSIQWVRCFALQPDGKILIGGDTRQLQRLNPNGSIDPSFSMVLAAADPPGFVSTIALQTDGRIIFGGRYSAVNGTPRNCIARVNADGTVDASFDPKADGFVFDLSLQADGKVLAAGNFTSIGGASRDQAARLLNDPAVESLMVTDHTRIEWLRGGSAPETTQVTFELSTDGATWTLLGAGKRIAGGWELTGLRLPEFGAIRARARIVCGDLNGSSGLVQATTMFGVNAAPEAFPAPAVQTRELGVERVVVTGEVADLNGDELTYQWLVGTTRLSRGTVNTSANGSRVAIAGVDLASSDRRLGLGTHQVSLRVSDGVNPPVSAAVSVKIVDTKAPTLTAPPDQRVNATRPQGAKVNYPAPVAHDAGGPVDIACSKASGTVFPIGTTTVRVTATDGAGNKAQATFKVTVLGAADQLDALMAAVRAMNLRTTTRVLLVGTLSLAKMSVQVPPIARGLLRGFIEEVRLQRGHTLTAAQADWLTGEARRIIAVLGG